ncbi:hypothetical protein [Chitinophaga nivalis]|uniref:hypothetical protein n=1 Tax=Chitinophaga nivalis TaxID=2991709 RepID=UPI0022281C23|nr:hypothetical protein [Chitinophaga nivalis]MCW3466702.1 hypothetical protein [Chitinophaga nivalis]
MKTDTVWQLPDTGDTPAGKILAFFQQNTHHHCNICDYQLTKDTTLTDFIAVEQVIRYSNPVYITHQPVFLSGFHYVRDNKGPPTA